MTDPRPEKECAASALPRSEEEMVRRLVELKRDLEEQRLRRERRTGFWAWLDRVSVEFWFGKA